MIDIQTEALPKKIQQFLESRLKRKLKPEEKLMCGTKSSLTAKKHGAWISTVKINNVDKAQKLSFYDDVLNGQMVLQVPGRKITALMVNGRVEGEEVERNIHGSILAITPKTHGKRDGVRVTFSNGKQIYNCNYVNDIPTGLEENYPLTGTMKRTWHYADPESGVSKSFVFDQKPNRKSLSMVEGNKTYTETYDTDWNLLSIRAFRNGQTKSIYERAKSNRSYTIKDSETLTLAKEAMPTKVFKSFTHAKPIEKPYFPEKSYGKTSRRPERPSR